MQTLHFLPKEPGGGASLAPEPGTSYVVVTATLMNVPDPLCPSCGIPYNYDDLYCTACGTSLAVPSGPPDPAPPEVPWTVGQIAIGLFFFLGLIIVSAFVARAAGPLYPAQQNAFQAWLAVHLLAASAIAVVWFMGLRRTDRPMLAVGMVKPRIPAVAVVLLVLGALGFSILATFAYNLVVDYLAIEALKPPEIEPDIIFSGAGILLTLQALSIVTPLSEEILFRGFVLRGLLRYMGPGPAVVATSIVFSAFHLEPGTVVPIFFTGLAFGFLYTRTGSLWPCIAAHAGQNAIAIIVVRAGL